MRAADTNSKAALQLLTTWNGIETADSAATALFEVWLSRHLGPVFKDAALSTAGAAVIVQPNTAHIIDHLEHPDALLGNGATTESATLAKRDQILLVSLNAAYTSLQQRLGADHRQWRWANLHYALLEHPLANATDPATKAKLNVGPFAKAGGSHTVNVSSYNPNTFQQTGGASFRIVVDVGNWDNSHAINTPGQSGNPDSPHYRDLALKWSKGEYFPLLYSRKMIDAAVMERIELQPAK